MALLFQRTPRFGMSEYNADDTTEEVETSLLHIQYTSSPASSYTMANENASVTPPPSLR